jgi:hypothetical protein
MVNKLSPFTSSFLEFLIETKPTDESTQVKKVMTFNDKDFKERNLLSSPSALASTNKKVGNLVSHQLLTVNDPYQTYIATSKVSSGPKGSNHRVKEEKGRNSQSKSPSGSRKQLPSKSPTTTTQDHQRNRLKAMKSPRKAVLEAVRRKDTTNSRKGEEEGDDETNEVMVEFDTVDAHRNTNSGKSRGRPRVGSSEKKKTTHQRNEEEEVEFNTEVEDIEWTTNHPMVGKKVAAFFSLPNPTETFQNILYYGTVMKYAPPSSSSSSSASSSSSFSAENDALYRIKWSDGDSEDYDEEQLKRGIDLYLQQTSWITDAKVNSVIGMKVANYFDIVDPMTVTTTTTVKAEKGSNHGSGKKGGKKNVGKEKEEIKYIQKIFRGIVIKYLPPSKEYTATTTKNNGDGDSTKKKQKEANEKSLQEDHSIVEEMIDNDDKMKQSLSEEGVVKNTSAVVVGAEDDDEEEGDQLYHIKWEDGDEQDYSENELQRARKIYLDHFIHQVLPATLPVFVNPLSSEAKINPSSGKPAKPSSSDPVTASWDTSTSKGLKTSTASDSSIVSPPKSSSSSSNKSLSVTSSSSSKASLTSSHAKKNRGNPSSSSSAPAISSPHATSTYSVSTSSSIFSNLHSSGMDDGRVWLTSGYSCLHHHVAGHFTIPNLSFSSSLGGNKLILLGKVLKYSPETTRRANNALYYIEWEDGAEEVYSQSQYEKGKKIYNVLANKAGQEGNKEREKETSSGRKEKVKTKKRILEQTVDMEEEEEEEDHVLEDEEEEEDSEMDLPDGNDEVDNDDIMVANSSSVAEERKKSKKLQVEKKQLVNFSRKRKQPEVSQLVENDDEEENSEQNVDDEGDDDDDIEIQIEKLPKKRKVTTEIMEKEIPVVISSASLTLPSSASAVTDSSSSSATATTAVEVVSLSSDSIEMQQDVVMEESMLPDQTGNNETNLAAETESPPEECPNDECLKKEDSSFSLISSAVAALEDPSGTSCGRTHYRFVDNPVIEDGSGDQVPQS